MKKLLILLALCMAFSVVLVACETTPDTSDETTDAETTTEEVTTEPEAETSTEEVTTEPEDQTTEPEDQTTEPADQTTPEEESTEPTPDPVKVIAALSWDTLATVHPVASKPIIKNGGEFLTWDGIANVDTNDKALSAYGWVAYFTETEGTVGYSFNGGEIVYNDSFTFTAEVGVQDHIHAYCPGALSACRFQFDIPLEGLGAGSHTLCVYAKDTAGNVEMIKQITVNIEQVDPVEEIVPVEFDGTNGTVTVPAGSAYKFIIANQGGKTMTIANTASCTVTAGTYTLPAETIDANGARIQSIPGPDAGWDNFVLTIVNPTDAAIEIVLTIQ